MIEHTSQIDSYDVSRITITYNTIQYYTIPYHTVVYSHLGCCSKHSTCLQKKIKRNQNLILEVIMNLHLPKTITGENDISISLDERRSIVCYHIIPYYQGSNSLYERLIRKSVEED